MQVTGWGPHRVRQTAAIATKGLRWPTLTVKDAATTGAAIHGARHLLSSPPPLRRQVPPRHARGHGLGGQQAAEGGAAGPVQQPGAAEAA
eukprot:CAMPEP_0183524240 /NCGR_PEP_ID=MMETSP0371-20130417/19751_1 /TAXON_ID=268820 /ORGANISM="Peridinium aciculiferum, Strain PAER-2" /LENGTH=89 /DNA_ID=CAMNT_0025723313 /DNA_START=26 /DNA_END=291 /DNA_ORIENTATION=-